MRPTAIASNLFYMSAGEASHNVCVVIPAYKVQKEILNVLEKIPDFVSRIIVVDDGCPNETGKLVQENTNDKRVAVVFNEENLGVGGAMVEGYKLALEGNYDIIVKVDGDGQMEPRHIKRLIGPLLTGTADYAKGNRFDSLEDLERMPKLRIFGNAGLSLLSKFSTGYWDINDPTNGFTAIRKSALERIALPKLRRTFFFESDVLFRLSLIRAVVIDVPMQALYGSEKSNLKIGKTLLEFPRRHAVNTIKRIFYNYYLREWNVASLELPAGIIAIIFGVVYGASTWARLGALGVPATSGQTLIAAVPIILGFQLLLSFLNYDVSSVPRRVQQR